MGLDMMLYSGSDIVEKVDGEYTYKSVKNGEEIAYWRKANAIHNWFVQNVQNGEDDCGTYEVTVEHLDSLLDDVKAVLSGSADPDDLLPTSSGFFFGSTDYDDYYFGSLKYTEEAVANAHKALASGKKVYYLSSW